jgi:hypothetical protein
MNYLSEKSGRYKFKLYKFTGDGWLLLFNENVNGDTLFNFLETFCWDFDAQFKKSIFSVLERRPKVVGLTFGMDRGSLLTFQMKKRKEYVGRSINVACRLQGKIKIRRGSPGYKVRIAKHFFNSLKINHPLWKFKEKKETFHNVDEERCITFMEAALPKVEATDPRRMITGKWKLTWGPKENSHTEIADIEVNGFYWVEGKHRLTLTNFDFDSLHGVLSFDKIRPPNNKFHHREILKKISDNLFEGHRNGNTEHLLRYERQN